MLSVFLPIMLARPAVFLSLPQPPCCPLAFRLGRGVGRPHLYPPPSLVSAPRRVAVVLARHGRSMYVRVRNMPRSCYSHSVVVWSTAPSPSSPVFIHIPCCLFQNVVLLFIGWDRSPRLCASHRPAPSPVVGNSLMSRIYVVHLAGMWLIGFACAFLFLPCRPGCPCCGLLGRE